jgi:hypothetical protein
MNRTTKLLLCFTCVALLYSCRTVHLVKTTERQKMDSTAIQHVDSVRISHETGNYTKTDSTAVKSTQSENKGIDFSVEFFEPDSAAKKDSSPVTIGYVNDQLSVDAGHSKIKSISFKNVSTSQRDLLIKSVLKINSSTNNTDSTKVITDKKIAVSTDTKKDNKDKSISGLQILGFTVFCLLLVGAFVLAFLMYKEKVLKAGKENDLIG